MSQNIQDDSVVDPKASGHEGEPKTAEKVSHETYLRVLDEAKKAKEKARAYEAKLAEIEKVQREAEDRKLHEQGEYKKILEQREVELADFKSKFDGLNSTLQNSIKKQAVLKVIGGELKNPAYSQFIDVESIAFSDADKFEVDMGTVQSVANKFLEEHADLIKRSKAATPPGNSPSPNGNGSLTYEQWLKLPLKEQKSRMQDVIKK